MLAAMCFSAVRAETAPYSLTLSAPEDTPCPAAPLLPEDTPSPEPGTPVPESTPLPEPADRWEALLYRYAEDEAVRELVFVKYQAGSTAHVELHVKTEAGWEKTLSCRGYVGMNGIDKVREGDKRTPTGDFGIVTAFGIKSNPGTELPYIKVTGDLYCCADEEFYNKIVSKNDMHHRCTGERLINYKPAYNYGLFPDYNIEGEYGKGSAIFMHCFGSKKYTAGCVAVSEANMATILKSLHEGARICIFPQ